MTRMLLKQAVSYTRPAAARLSRRYSTALASDLPDVANMPALPPPPDPALPSIPPNPSLNPLRLDLCSPLVAVRQAPGRVHGGVRAHRVVHQVNPCSSAGVTCD